MGVTPFYAWRGMPSMPIAEVFYHPDIIFRNPMGVSTPGRMEGKLIYHHILWSEEFLVWFTWTDHAWLIRLMATFRWCWLFWVCWRNQNMPEARDTGTYLRFSKFLRLEDITAFLTCWYIGSLSRYSQVVFFSFIMKILFLSNPPWCYEIYQISGAGMVSKSA